MNVYRTALLVSGMALAAGCSGGPAAGSFAVSTVGTCPAGPAHVARAAGAPFTGSGTATNDGRLSPGEWDGAGRLDFAMNLPESEGGGTAPATLLAMNDGAGLHLAVRMEGNRLGQGMSVFFEFDSDRSGVLSAGDDGLGYSAWPGGLWSFVDVFRWPCPREPAALCSFLDDDLTPGLPPPGAIEGAGAHTAGAEATIVEETHPLDSGDRVHDVALKAGDVVGFNLSVRTLAADPACSEYPRCYGDTDLPPFWTGFVQYAVSPASSVMPVAIDVKPGSDENPIQLGARGKIPVAILGSESFDARAVDASAAVFAGAHVQRRPNGTLMASIEDVDGDGWLDMVLHFAVEDLNLAADATSATLEGRTCDGQLFTGNDRVRIVPGHEPVEGVLFDSFGPGDSYTPGSGWTLGHDFGASWVQAIGFVAPASGSVTRYQIAVFRNVGGARLDAWLRADAGGSPGSLIEQFAFPVLAGSIDLMLSADSAVRPSLGAGTRYWLVVAPPDLATELFGWYRNPPIDGVLNAQGHDPLGPWYVWAGDYAPTLKISGIPD
jgi:hypothetical protein